MVKLLAIKSREGTAKRLDGCHRYLRWGLIVFILSCGSAQANTVRLLVSGEQNYYRETQEYFSRTLLALSPDTRIAVTVLDDSTEQNALLAPWPEDIIVTIGTPATELAYQNRSGKKTINLFITSDVWRRLEGETPDQTNVASVVLDQSPDRIMLLARILAPRARKAATVTGPISSANIAALEQSAASLNFSLAAKTLSERDNPVAAMSPLIKNCDVFVALPDSAVFNRATAKWALYLGFRSKVPVIGFSKAYTDAGALASIYASPSNIGRHGAELTADALLETKAFEAGLHYPRYYTLHANPSVAKALNIPLPNERALYKMYEEALAKRP